MNCHLCNDPLTPDSYSTWNIGSEHMVIHRCKNELCNNWTTVADKIEIDIVFPSREIIGYTALFQIRNKWYRIYSFSGAPNLLVNKPGTKLYYYGVSPTIFSGGFKKSEELLHVERYYSLSYDEPLWQQLEFIYDKLQTLLLFS